MERIQSPRTDDSAIEQEIVAKGLTAPRVTPADIEANIASEHYFTAADGARLVTEEMVGRFLGWKLPADFHPDGGISFKAEGDYDHPQFGRAKHEPTGTNLFHAGQALGLDFLLDLVVGCHGDLSWVVAGCGGQ